MRLSCAVSSGCCPAGRRKRRRSRRSGCSRCSIAARNRPGIAVSDGEQLMLYKDLGMISTVLDERRLPSLRGTLAIAHCRYSTTGSTVWENAQPTYRLGPRRAIAVGHNGDLVNTRGLLGQLEGGRARLPASTDTELLTAFLADEPASDTVEALVRVLPRVRGAFSLVILDQKRVIGVRDPHGFRPLVLGRLPRPPSSTIDRRSCRYCGSGTTKPRGSGWCLSSETASLDMVGAEFVRDVEPGEIIVLEPGRAPRVGAVRRAEPGPGRVRAHLFRPPRFLHGGPQPVRGAPADGRGNSRSSTRIDADLVIPVPDTGAPAAAGFSEAIGAGRTARACIGIGTPDGR